MTQSLKSSRYQVMLSIFAKLYAGGISGGLLFTILHIYLSGAYLVRIGTWSQTSIIGVLNGGLLGLLSCLRSGKLSLVFGAIIINLAILAVNVIESGHANSLALLEFLSSMNIWALIGFMLASVLTVGLIQPTVKMLQTPLWGDFRREANSETS